MLILSRPKKNSIEGNRTFNEETGSKMSEKSTRRVNSENPDDEVLYESEPSQSFSRNSIHKSSNLFTPKPRVSTMDYQDDQKDSDNEDESPLLARQAEFLNRKYHFLENASDSDWNFKNIANFRDCPLLVPLIELKELGTSCLNKRVIGKEMIIKIDAIQLRFLLKLV